MMLVQLYDTDCNSGIRRNMKEFFLLWKRAGYEKSEIRVPSVLRVRSPPLNCHSP